MIKKTTVLFALIMAAMIGMQACKNQEKKQTNDADSLTTDVAADSLKSMDKIETAKGILDKPVGFLYADTCIKDYLNKPYGTIPKTHGVKFKSPELIAWMSKLSTYSDVDEIRVEFGIYTPGILRQYRGKPENVNKVTVFFMPYHKNNHAVIREKALKGDSVKVDPYNLGEIYP